MCIRDREYRESDLVKLDFLLTGDPVAALISWWNNNSFTSAAIQADAEYARLKQKSE